jgi:hypothetical protein
MSRAMSLLEDQSRWKKRWSHQLDNCQVLYRDRYSPPKNTDLSKFYLVHRSTNRFLNMQLSLPLQGLWSLYVPQGFKSINSVFCPYITIMSHMVHINNSDIISLYSLRHCATNRKFVSSIPDGVFCIDIILPAALRTWGQLSLWQKWEPGIFPGV